MVARLLWEQDVGSSSLFTSTTRLSLDAFRAPGSVFFFCFIARGWGEARVRSGIGDYFLPFGPRLGRGAGAL